MQSLQTNLDNSLLLMVVVVAQVFDSTGAPQKNWARTGVQWTPHAVFRIAEKADTFPQLQILVAPAYYICVV